MVLNAKVNESFAQRDFQK